MKKLSEYVDQYEGIILKMKSESLVLYIYHCSTVIVVYRYVI
jgi:hypothetical protein